MLSDIVPLQTCSQADPGKSRRRRTRDPRIAMPSSNEIGRDVFLKKYGYRRARNYYVEHNGKRYDSKAIIGAAFGYQFPDHGPLKTDEFSGGDATVRRTLDELGFRVHSNNPDPTEKLTSIFERILDLQASWTSQNIPEMELRGQLIRKYRPQTLGRHFQRRSLTSAQ